MADIITDELRLLIKAEAGEALKELSSYRSGIDELNKSQASAADKAMEAQKAIDAQADAMKKAREILAQAKKDIQDEGLARELIVSTLSDQERAQERLNHIHQEASRLRDKGLITEDQYNKVMAREAQAVYDLSTLARDRASAEQLVASLLTNEQIAQEHLNATMAEASNLKSQGLITDEQYLQLLQRETSLVEEASGLTRDKAAAQQLVDGTLSESERAQKLMNETLEEANRLKEAGLLSEKDYQAVVAKAKATTEAAAKGTLSYSQGLEHVNTAQSVVKTGALAMGKALLVALGPIATITGTIMLIKNFIGDANEAYAQSEGEARKFAITYRDVAEDAEEAARDWADTFKYAESTAKSVLGSAGDMYTGMGMSGEAALKLAERTTYLGGALSKLNPQIGSASDATKALITATTGEREALKTWGIIISETAIQTKLLERGQQNLTGAALLNAKAQATLDVAYEQSPNALAAVTSATELAADTNRELSESWKELLELEGQSMNKFFQPIKKALAGWIQNMNEAKRAKLDLMKIDPNTDLIEAYGKTADRVDELADTYENLKAKTSLSKSEQADLKTVMAELATLVPTSVTAWNEYGEAIGVSALAARNFASQQRELRIAEAEYQALRLKHQQNEAKASYEENKQKAASTVKKIADAEKEMNALQAVYEIARQAKDVLADPTEGRAGLSEFLRANSEILKGSSLDIDSLTQTNGWGQVTASIDAVIGQYQKLSNTLDGLKAKQAEYAVGMKEYEIISLQIRQAEAELILLTGSQEEQVRILEEQIGPIRNLESEFISLKGHYEAGTISIDQYIAGLQQMIAKSKEAAKTDPTPDLTKWQTFVAGITKSANISDAINLEVKLSPIMDPDNGRALLSEQLDYYQDLINQLWQNKQSFSGLDEWQTALDQLVEKYDDVKAKVDANAFKDTVSTDQQKAEKVLKKTIEDANKLRQQGLLTEKEMGAVIEKAYRTYDDASGKTKLRQRSQELIATTLTEQQAAMHEILLLETELRILQDHGLVTEEQSKAIIDAKREALADALGKESSLSTFIKDSWKDIEENYLSLDAVGKLMSDTFSDIGTALASGEDALAASGKALQAFVSNLLGELATMAIGAGLRVIAESGWAGVPLALALFALGGIAGIGGGFFSGSGKGLDSSISDTLSDEIKLRQSLNETLEEQLGIEETLLKRQLDRNLISEEDYRDSMLGIQQEKNQGQAQGDALSLVNSMIGEIDAELSSLSGWTKFWTKKDENLESKASDLEGIAKAINAAVSAEELKALIAQLESYGIDTSSIPAFATGGSFVTSGESIVRIGDNSSGRELVNITPLGSAGFHSGQSIVVNINGPVIGYEDLYMKLEAAGITLNRKRLA